MSDQAHNVAVRIGSTVVEKWSDYAIEVDMLHPADSFQLQLGNASREAWELCKPDSPVQVLLDDTVILTGRIDDRTRRVDRGGSQLSISGRDKSGRLVDESMELRTFKNLTVRQLVETVVKPWFPSVIFSNAENRKAVRGKHARVARSSKEPALTIEDPAAIWGKKRERRVDPGESRWQVVAKHLEEVGLIAWSTADGQSIVVGQPNYDQEPQYRFFLPKPGSDRIREGNIMGYTLHDSVGERYSQITAVGAGRGDATNYGEDTVKHLGVVRDGLGAYGIGKDFQARKTLVVADDKVTSPALAEVRAKREMAERDSTGRRVTLTVKGHSQLMAAAVTPTLYACDCMALVEDEEMGVSGLFLITTVHFSHSRSSGETTELDLVPKGTLLKGA